MKMAFRRHKTSNKEVSNAFFVEMTTHRALSFLVLLLCINLVSSGSVNDCRSVRYVYQSVGLDLRDVPKQPRQGSQLEICPRGLTCCTEEMERKLRSVSIDQYGKAVTSASETMRRLFSSRSAKFDGLFPELLARSKLEFHRLFRDTYGIIYIKNSDVFIDFFNDLNSYYEHGNVNLEEALRRFFTFLYQRMFTVYNAQYEFSPRYLKCVSTTMKDLKPFGDVPQKLTEQLRQSFVATRTFNQALLQGKKIINRIIKIQPMDKCVNALTKMSSCPACEGHSEIKPCNDYCVNVMRGCLAYHSEFGASWDKYIENLQVLSDRMLGPFNIEDVVDPIGIKISDAIMNFQRGGFDVTQKIYAQCGSPRLEKRDADGYYYGHTSSIRRPGRRAKKQRRRNNNREKQNGASKLKSFIRDIREAIAPYKGFWSRLPAAMCKDESMGGRPGSSRFQGGRKISDSSGKCWNGHGAGSYTSHVVSDGLSHQTYNPEVKVDVGRVDPDIQEQIFALKAINQKMNRAIKGENVEWVKDTAGYHYEGSGGCDTYSDDEDCTDYSDHFSGSGDYEDNDFEDHAEEHVEQDVGNVRNVEVPVVHSDDDIYESNGVAEPKKEETEEEEYDEYGDDNWPPWVTSPTSAEADNEADIKVIDTNDIDDHFDDPQPKMGSGTSSISTTRAVIYYLVPIVVTMVGSLVSSSLSS